MAMKDSIEDYTFLPLTKRMKDLTGQKFGRLVALGVVGKYRKKTSIWLCQCECGNLTQPLSGSLISGKTTSCGCLNAESASKTCIRLRTTHGMTESREHSSWDGMLTRCYNRNSTNYRRYGGRGITVCPRWRESFENFYSDMGVRPAGRSLERKDNNKGYSPGNCKWASLFEQQNNTRSNRVLTYGGRSMTIAQWSEEFGTNYHTLWGRLYKLGWSTAKALTTPVRGKNT